jgi:hypothetical protein
MKKLLIITIGTFLIGCGNDKSTGKSSKMEAQAKMSPSKSDHYFPDIDSIAAYIKSPAYDSLQITSNALATAGLNNYELLINAEKGLATEIVAATFTHAKPYEFAASISTSSCDAFNTIERNQFRSGTQTYYTTVTRNDDNKLKLFGMVKGEFKKNSKAFILDFCNYLDTTCIDENRRRKVRLAAGLRIVYFVKDWGLSIGMDGLEKIAAAKELNFSESSLEVKTIGWGQNNDAIDSLREALQKISVKNYPEACSALINLLGAYKTARSLKPQVIPLE